MLSRALNTGIRLKPWKTKPTLDARQRARSAPERSASDWPATLTVPSSGRSRPPIKFSKVDFPDPDGPMNA